MYLFHNVSESTTLIPSAVATVKCAYRRLCNAASDRISETRNKT